MTGPQDPGAPGKTDPTPDPTLRQRAEARLDALDASMFETMTPAEIACLIHELRVHRIELELRNEELLRSQEALEISRTRYFDLYDLAPVGYLTLSEGGLIQESNLAAARLLETPRGALAGQPLSRFVLPEDQDPLYQCRRRLWSSGEPQSCALRLRSSGETPRWIRLETSRAREPSADRPRWQAILSDITASKLTESRLLAVQSRLQRVAAIAELGFWEWYPATKSMYFPPEWCQRTGYDADEIPRSLEAWAALVHPEDRERILDRVTHFAIAPRPPNEIQYRLRRKDGDYRWVAARLEAILDADGRFDHILHVHQDVTQRKESEDRALQLAQHDPLTGLPMRVLLDQLADHMIAGAKRSGTRLAVLFVDLDHFKAVNDIYGHAIGDTLLRLVARRLRESFRAEDLVARLGGDEFILMLANIHDDEDAAHAARTAIAALSRPYAIEGMELHCLPSIGISLYPTNGTTLNELIQRADMAMYHAKLVSPGHYQFVTESLNQRARTTLDLESQLRDLMPQSAFQLVYQPIMDLRRGTVSGIEALLRWPQLNGGDIPPLTFLPIADSIGLSPSLGKWVFQEVCRQHQAWLAAGLPPLRISVNVSARQFRHECFLHQITEALRHSGVHPNSLSIDLSEAALLQDMTVARRILQALHAIGVRVALDDFGMGCSCLSEFEHLQLDRLEINRKLVQRLGEGPRMPAIVETIARLGRALGLEVNAVGIETEAELRFFRHLGCDQAQGFYLGVPMSGDAFIDWYRQRFAAGPPGG